MPTCWRSPGPGRRKGCGFAPTVNSPDVAAKAANGIRQPATSTAAHWCGSAPADPPAATLALVAAVALEEAVAALVGTPPSFSSNGQTTCCSIAPRFRASFSNGSVTRSSIGVGVNLAHHPALIDRPTTSLTEHGAAITPADFTEKLAELFAAWLFQVAARRPRPNHPALDRSGLIRRGHGKLAANLPDGEVITGAFVRLAADGALVLGLADGSERVIHAADVFPV